MAYITDLTHFLDKTGNIPKNIPKEARNLASFLALIVDEVTRCFPRTGKGIETSIKCFKPTCNANVIAALDIYDSPVKWHCPNCGNTGTISNWQNLKWDNTKPHPA